VQKENIQAAYQNHYLQYPSPQPPSEANQWAPATPSTQPPPPPQQYSVSVSIQQPNALILLCQVQEPLEVNRIYTHNYVDPKIHAQTIHHTFMRQKPTCIWDKVFTVSENFTFIELL